MVLNYVINNIYSHDTNLEMYLTGIITYFLKLPSLMTYLLSYMYRFSLFIVCYVLGIF